MLRLNLYLVNFVIANTASRPLPSKPFVARMGAPFLRHDETRCDPSELVPDAAAALLVPGTLVHVELPAARPPLEPGAPPRRGPVAPPTPCYGWGAVDGRTVGMVRELGHNGEVRAGLAFSPSAAFAHLFWGGGRSCCPSG